MGKLIYYYGAMGCSKTANALMTIFQYEENSRKVCLIKPEIDNRDDIGHKSIIKSRIGLQAEAYAIKRDENIVETYSKLESDFLDVDVIICDEIGADTDILAIQNVANAGTILIASIHADSFSGLLKRPQFQRLMATSVFETAIVLSGREAPGKTKEFIPLKRYWR